MTSLHRRTAHDDSQELAIRLGHILNATANEVYFMDPQTMRFIEVNHDAVLATGYSAEEFLRMSPIDIAPLLRRDGAEIRIGPLQRGEVRW